MTNAEKLTLKKHAYHIRMGVIEGTHSAGCGHPGNSRSLSPPAITQYAIICQ